MSSDNVTRQSGRQCVLCGGSWAGKAFDTRCAHDFDEAPMPDVTRSSLVRCPDMRPMREQGWIAFGGGSVFATNAYWVQHPTREGAIAAWQQAWRERRDRVRLDAEAPVVTVPTAREAFEAQYNEVVEAIRGAAAGPRLTREEMHGNIAACDCGCRDWSRSGSVVVCERCHSE